MLKRISGLLFASIIWLDTGCDFQNPADFEVPTWNVDLVFPLIHERYYLGNIVDSVQIFSAPDSGMQIIFEDTLPGTAIDESYLEANFPPDGYIEVTVPPEDVSGPEFDFPLTVIEIDTSVPVFIGVLTDTSGNMHTILPYEPPGTDIIISASEWNDKIADAFNDAFSTIEIPSPPEEIFDKDDIPLPSEPEIIEEIVALVIQDNPASSFVTSIGNNGVAKPITNTTVRLTTGDSDPSEDTLAVHETTAISNGETFSDTTSLSNQRLHSFIVMGIGFSIDTETEASTVTISADDSLKVDIHLEISIPGVDSADVLIANVDLPVDIPEIEFPSDIEIYKGVFKSEGVQFDENRLEVSDLTSNYPFDIDFLLDFENFQPPAGEEEVKIDTTLKKGVVNDFPFDLKGYSLSSSGYPDSPITALELAVQATIPSQSSTIPLDGSSLGNFSMNVRMYDLKFVSLELNLIKEFPASTQNLEGMPQGFEGMGFTDVQIEFEMLNEIKLPVALGIEMVGHNQAGDSITVLADAVIGTPATLGDTSKTIIRLSNQGSASYFYASPVSPDPFDSVKTDPGGATIVDLLSFNPATLVVKSAASIDGRGSIVVGASIGGEYRLIAPFEVWMDEMTFIPVNKTPLDEMSHETRNKLRNSLLGGSVTARVINHIPVGGDISMLFSNLDIFPMDSSSESLRALRDSMVVREEGWSTSDSIYIVTDCSSLTPRRGDIHIFNVMADSSDCVDGLPYLVRNTGLGGPDTVISYVDTLFKIILPDPDSLYGADQPSGREGAVYLPGDGAYTSAIDTNSIRLLSDLGEHFIAPRFHLNGTISDGDTQTVFLSMGDYIEISSFMTFRIKSTGLLEEAENELVIVYPNGGDTLIVGDTVTVRWRALGDEISKQTVSVFLSDVAAGIPSLLSEDDWEPISQDPLTGGDESWPWVPEAEGDSLWLRICNEDRSICDMSGWFFTVVSGGEMAAAKPGHKKEEEDLVPLKPEVTIKGFNLD